MRAETPLQLHRRLPGYAPTPLLELPPGLAPGAARTLVKLESCRFGLPSFKVLGSAWAAYSLLCDRLGDGPTGPPDLADLGERLRAKGRIPVLVTASDGNHGRAVAWTARQLGIGAEVVVPQGTSRSRIEAIEREGAEVEVAGADYDQAVARAAARSGGDRLLLQDTAVPGQAGAEELIVAGYSTIFSELGRQLRGSGAGLTVVVPVGVGSLALAALRYLRSRGGRPRLVTVEPTEAASLERSLAEGRPVTLPGPQATSKVGLRCGSISAAAWPELALGVEEAVTVDDQPVDRALCELAGLGVEVGECGAAPLAALRRLGAGWSAAAGTIVLLATEGPTDAGRWRQLVGRDPSPPRTGAGEGTGAGGGPG